MIKSGKMKQINNRKIAKRVLDKEHIEKHRKIEISRGALEEIIVKALKEKDFVMKVRAEMVEKASK